MKGREGRPTPVGGQWQISVEEFPVGEGLGFRRTTKQGVGSALVTTYLGITHGSIFKG